MAGVLLHDGQRIGHLGWCVDAVSRSVADGVIVSPFSTPRVAVPRCPSGQDLAAAVRDVDGDVVFDPTTHARLLPGVDRTDHYDTWELWGSAGVGLDTTERQIQHVERVFLRQAELGVPYLAPTVALDSPNGSEARFAKATAQVAKGLQRETWQALAGRRSFWKSGHQLDAFVGGLAALRAPVWLLTMVNDLVVDATPDLSDVDAFVGFCRTVHSLSERSRVIVAHADLSGMLGVAAGADTVGSGWDRSMRTFDPSAYRVASGGPRRPASVVTQGGLTAVLRRDAADAIDRWNSVTATVIRGGAMPPSDAAERVHHLRCLRNLVVAVDDQPHRLLRVKRLRSQYDNAGAFFDTLIGALPRVVRPQDKLGWQARQFAVLEAYASAEGLW